MANSQEGPRLNSFLSSGFHQEVHSGKDQCLAHLLKMRCLEPSCSWKKAVSIYRLELTSTALIFPSLTRSQGNQQLEHNCQASWATLGHLDYISVFLQDIGKHQKVCSRGHGGSRGALVQHHGAARRQHDQGSTKTSCR